MQVFGTHAKQWSSWLTASDSGFVVHFDKYWLGASPDAWVIDPSVEDTNGIAEFKCPYREDYV